jgi:hypothetical protein
VAKKSKKQTRAARARNKKGMAEGDAEEKETGATARARGRTLSAPLRLVFCPRQLICAPALLQINRGGYILLFPCVRGEGVKQGLKFFLLPARCKYFACSTEVRARRPMGLRLCDAGSWRFIAEARHFYWATPHQIGVA